MIKIEWAESLAFNPLDRDYNKKGKPRESHMEIFGNGICYALMTTTIPFVVFVEKEE